MQDIKQALCSAMYRFVSDKINELKPRDTLQEQWYGFGSKVDMLKCISNDWQDAGWALTELCDWGFNKNYRHTLFVADTLDDDYETAIYCIVDDDGNKRYIMFEYDGSDAALFSNIYELNRVTKMVEQTMWEEV